MPAISHYSGSAGYKEWQFANIFGNNNKSNKDSEETTTTDPDTKELDLANKILEGQINKMYRPK